MKIGFYSHNFNVLGKYWENLKDIADFENKIIERCKSDKPEIIDSILSSGKLEENSEKSLIEVITNLKKNFKS